MHILTRQMMILYCVSILYILILEIHPLIKEFLPHILAGIALGVIILTFDKLVFGNKNE